MLHELLAIRRIWRPVGSARPGDDHVEITGSETGRQLTLHWKEEGGPPMAEPGRKGLRDPSARNERGAACRAYRHRLCAKRAVLHPGLSAAAPPIGIRGQLELFDLRAEPQAADFNAPLQARMPDFAALGRRALTRNCRHGYPDLRHRFRTGSPRRQRPPAQ